jgi:hypothetical protein
MKIKCPCDKGMLPALCEQCQDGAAATKMCDIVLAAIKDGQDEIMAAFVGALPIENN